MTRFTRLCLALILVSILGLTNPNLVVASRGAPGSPEYGFGAILYPNGPYVKDALALAADLGLDWISVPVVWSAVQPDGAIAPRLEALDEIMAFAAQRQIAVLVSITNPPVWAQTAQGPDAARATQLVAALIQRYPAALQAVELFPGANTLAGWGSPPSPQAYFNLLQRASRQLRELNSPVVLVAGGLRPLGSSSTGKDHDDLAFLKELYQLGAAEIMPVVSLQYDELIGDPLRFPDGLEHRVFRHYEEVRQVMLANRHQKGLIWITRLSLPSGKIEASDSVYKDINLQANWLAQSYIQTRSQLYVGVNFGQSLNPGAEGVTAGVPTLLLSAGSYHPFYSVMREMISLNKAGKANIMPGRPKEGNFAKNRP